MVKRSLVLITGTGRSGTSTMSGSLHHLGLTVPGPFLGANESNPKGFFESVWAVKFHKSLVAAAGVNVFDSRPAAFDRVQAAITPEVEQRLRTYLHKHQQATQLVVKDPRSVWTQGLWREVAAEDGRSTDYVSMLRHPAEVIGSRTTYYASKEAVKRQHYQVFNVARWINNSLINERETRGHSRAFVRYVDLLTDWRPVLAGVGETLGLTYDPPINQEPHPLDEFIDPGLRRHAVTWEDLDIPVELQQIAQDVWDALQVLVEGEDAAASGRLDGLAMDYARLLTDSAAISHDAIEEARLEAQQAAEAEQRDLARARAEGPMTARQVHDVPTRSLLRIAAGRIASRVRR